MNDKNDEILRRMLKACKDNRLNTDLQPMNKVYIPNNLDVIAEYPVIDYVKQYNTPRKNIICLIPSRRNNMETFSHKN